MYKELVENLRDKAEFLDKTSYGRNVHNAFADAMKQAADVIEKLTREDRKTGTWCADYDGYADGEPVYDMWWCSVCGEYFDEWDDRPTWKYCPQCGAKMNWDGEDA